MTGSRLPKGRWARLDRGVGLALSLSRCSSWLAFVTMPEGRRPAALMRDEQCRPLHGHPDRVGRGGRKLPARSMISGSGWHGGCLGLVLLGVAGCGVGAPMSPAESTVASGRSLVNPPSGTSVLVSDSDLLDEILADEQVTVVELERAYLAFLGCVKESGVSGRYAYDLNSGTGMSYEFFLVGDEDGTRIGPIVEDCQESMLGDLDTRYEKANPPTPAQVERVRSKLYGCLVAVAGEHMSDVPVDSSYEDLSEKAADIAGDTNLGTTAVAASGCVLKSRFGEFVDLG